MTQGVQWYVMIQLSREWWYHHVSVRQNLQSVHAIVFDSQKDLGSVALYPYRAPPELQAIGI